MPDYEPELGQAIFGNPTGEFEVPLFAKALFDGIVEHIKWKYWNATQREWGCYESPRVEGLEWRPYFWGDDDEPEAALPNFKFEGVEIRWYKHPGRGMSCNVEWSHQQWCEWFERCIKHISSQLKGTFDSIEDEPC